MIQLHDKDNGAAIGTITDEQFRFLQEQLEAESPGDDDYYFNADTLDLLEQSGADVGLLQLLRAGLGSRDEMELRWTRA